MDVTPQPIPPALHSKPAVNAAHLARTDWLLLGLVLLGGLAASGYAFQSTNKLIELRAHQVLSAHGQSIADTLGAEMQRSVESVRATGFMLAKPGDPMRADFVQFGQAVMANVPSLSFLEWQPLVPASELPRFEAMARAQGLPGFRLTEPLGTELVPVRPRAEYVPVLFGLPESGAALGVDMGFDPNRMASKWLARDTRQPQASETFPLISSNQTLGSTLGFAISVAVFRSEAAAVTANPAHPNAKLKGFVAGVFQLSGLMREAAARAEQAHIHLQVLDQTTQPPRLIFGAPAAAATEPHGVNGLNLPVEVAGRRWALVLQPQPAFGNTGPGSDARWVLLGGGLGTLLLVTALYRAQRSRRLMSHSQANTLAAERRVDQERQRLDNILEGTQAGTWEWHVPSGEVRLNERWVSMLGYNLAELMPISIATWQQLCHPDDLVRASDLLSRHFTRQLSSYTAELRMRHKAGHWVWVMARGCVISRTADDGPEWMAGTHLDVSESKRLHQQLIDMRMAIDAHAIVGITDANGCITYANDKFCEVSGYCREELIGQTHRVINSGHHPAEFFSAMWATIHSGKTWKGHIKNRAKTGALYWVDSTITPVAGPDGQPVQYIAIRYEITATKQYEASLLFARNQLQQAANIADLGIWTWTPASDFQIWNERMFEMYEMPAEMRGRGAYSAYWHSRIHPDDVAEVEQKLVAAVKGRGDYNPTFRIVANNGQSRYIQATAIVERDAKGRALQVMGINRDITVQRKLEDALRKSETRWRRILNEMPVGMCLVDAQKRIFFRNSRFTEMVGYSEDELPDLAAWWRLAYPDPEYTRWVKTSWDEAMRIVNAGGEVIPPVIYAVTCKNGEVRQIEIASRATNFGFLSTFVDLTQHQQQQRQLQAAQAQAEAASQAKSAFLANMSHEIRTPMSGTLGMLKLLLRTQLTTRQHDYAAKAQASTQALLGIINDILDFSKVESGKMEIEHRPFALSELMQTLAVMLVANQGDKDVELLFDIDPATPALLVGDELRLRQVLLNLAGNALKFTAQGEVVLGIAVRGQSADHLEIEFSVRDTGIGIPAEKLGQIFEGFSQAESSTSRRFGGTGLGLAISTRLIQLMGGTLQVHSTLGQGSHFHFTLRLQQSTPLQLAPPGPPEAPRRVLVVDDNATSRALLQTLCNNQGWACDSVGSGTAALAALQQPHNTPQSAPQSTPYSAVLIDWRMPELDGLETTRRLRQLSLGHTLPVVLMASTQDRAALEGSSQPPTGLLSGHLVKPVTAAALREALAQATSAAGPLASEAAPWQASQRLQGLRLLVVEDNLFNQQIAEELLSGEGAQVAIAGDGITGVAMALEANPAYDAVLMDLQMPGIDGFEATRRIRQHADTRADTRANTRTNTSANPHTTPRRLPIIAMTANAMASDRLACLDAGMDDHVGKPVDLMQLIDVLLRHTAHPAAANSSVRQLTPPPSTSTSTSTSTAPAPENLAPTPQPEALASDAAIKRLGGGRAFYLKLLRNFQTEAVLQMQGCTHAIAQHQLADAARHLHTLKGIAGTVGATALAAAAAHAEAALAQALAEGADAARLQQLHAPLQEALDTALRHVAEALSAVPAATVPLAQTPAPEFNSAAFQHALAHLMQLLQASDMGSTTACDALTEQFAPATTGPRLAQLQTLQQAVDQLDFAQALRTAVALQALAIS